MSQLKTAMKIINPTAHDPLNLTIMIIVVIMNSKGGERERGEDLEMVEESIILDRRFFPST